VLQEDDGKRELMLTRWYLSSHVVSLANVFSKKHNKKRATRETKKK